MVLERKIEKILKTKTGQDAIMEIDEILSPIYYENPNLLSKPEKIIAIIEELEREVNSGGFKSFFSYSVGDSSYKIVKALKIIGSTIFLDIVERAISVFPENKIPKESEVLEEILEDIEEKADPLWEKLEEEFYEYNEDIYELMITYIKKNLKDFR